MYVCACVRDVDIHVTCVHVQVLKENGDSAVLNKLTYSLLDTDVHRLDIYIYIYIDIDIDIDICRCSTSSRTRCSTRTCTG